MSVFGDIWHWLTEDDTQARALPDPDSIEGLTSRIRGGSPGPWRSPSIREALGVPAIFRSVALIANTTGALSLKAYREGRALPEAERPRLIVRPDPFRTPRSFFRDTAYNMATRGEAWWWVAKRDFDGNALSLISVPPAEVTVTEDPDDLRYPVIEWRGRRMKNADMRQITYLQEPGALRGHGPLQMCGAAVSVAVEAQEWAANFYADGGHPSVLIKAAGTLGEDLDTGEHEADLLRDQWVSRPNNMPRVIDETIEDVGYMQPNVQGAQMLEARVHQIGEAVRMLGVPASLIGYATPGSSLTYQNVGQELDKFTRTCLWPDYLEAIEQEMSDLLTRSTVARFNLDALTRADIKTRYEVYKLGTESGVLDAEEARTMEGLEPGDVENAPMPAAPPQAIPTILPVQGRTAEVRCDGRRVFRNRLERCNKLLAESGPFVGTCPRCKKEHAAVETRVETPAPRPVQLVMHHRTDPSEPEPVAAPAPAPSEPIVVNVPTPVVHVAPPVVNVPAAVVNVDTAPFTDAMRGLQEELRSTLAQRTVTKHVDRDEKGRIVAVRETLDEGAA